MNLPFSQTQFLENFARYNTAVYPVQLIFFGLAVLAVVWALKNNKFTDKGISGILVFFWLWMGIVYHFIFFSAINKAAYVFGSLFVIQAILFFIYGVRQNKIRFEFRRDCYAIAGLAFITFALVVYPILGFFFGHAYPANPTFGLPCPTTIFTFGILLMASRQFNRLLLVIPLLWAFIGFGAALSLGIREDAGLLVAGVSGAVMIWFGQRDKRKALAQLKE